MPKNKSKIKTDKRAQQRFKQKNQPQGATLAGQLQRQQTNQDYQRSKKKAQIKIK